MRKYILLIITFASFFSSFQVISAQANAIETEITDSLYSELLEENREFWVKFPENYNPDSSTKYPVVYLLDGFSLKNSLEAVYENYWGHYLPHMIIVGISNRTNRVRDLTTSQIKMRRGSVMNENTGGAENFTQFIEKELIPYIDKKYPTTPYRTLIGHSYAGLFTINMLINHKHVFENYIAIDPSIEWDDQNFLKEAKQKLTSENYKGKSLFVSLAAEQLHMWNEDITIDNIMDDSSEFTLFARSIIDFSTFAESEKQSGLNFYWKVYNEDLHGTVPLPSMRDGLVFLFKWYQFKSPQKYNNPETTVEELMELLGKQEEIYSTHFGYPFPPMIEEMLSGYGYMNLEMGQPEKAFMFFKMNINYYPKSASAQNSMADYYETKNDHASALKYVTKAFELSGENKYKDRIKELEGKN
ncbi:alpha/beta hydrolase-fold protein [Lutimonas zeaxanthinifaciens]|uniref:alpha/beta hydrolase-fold protein n=1 Tax=Lutimonas zeaxanthinifaciens TaxID=3060215 RepID=UPI00265D0AB7|nr:alpha/beta hydrolase-fold protein [Lutimonas sp. YSD2104]WKK67042.1 alpha/beta hydrolase-fold protein [Lutimonas sp. YSD2104]